MTGVTSRLSYDLKAYVALREAADGFTKDATKVFHPGQFVVGRVLSVDAAKRCCDLSLRVGADGPSDA